MLQVGESYKDSLRQGTVNLMIRNKELEEEKAEDIRKV